MRCLRLEPFLLELWKGAAPGESNRLALCTYPRRYTYIDTYRIPEEAKTVVCCRSFKQAIAQFFNLTKPPLYYSLGHKFDNILHTRLRLDLSGLHAHLFKINSHLVDTPNCSCEPIPETVKHYLFFCPRYVVQRKELESSLINYIKHYAKLTVNDKLAILVFGHNLNNATGLAVAASVQKYIRNT